MKCGFEGMVRVQNADGDAEKAGCGGLGRMFVLSFW